MGQAVGEPQPAQQHRTEPQGQQQAEAAEELQAVAASQQPRADPDGVAAIEQHPDQHLDQHLGPGHVAQPAGDLVEEEAHGRSAGR